MTVKSQLLRVIRRFGYELLPVEAAVPRGIRGDYATILEEIDAYSFKFLDVKTFLPRTLARAHRLGLHECQPLTILDIGTGVGWFPVVCNHYGHTVIAIDRAGNEVFADATKWLQVDRRTWEVKAREPLPDLGSRFDLITAFMVNFDREARNGYEQWTVTDWRFLLTDLRENQLKASGRFAMLLNQRTLAEVDVLAYLVACGARLDGSWVIFESLDEVPLRSESAFDDPF